MAAGRSTGHRAVARHVVQRDRSRRAIPANHLHDITVIGGSAGSIGVVRQLLRDLPVDYPAAVFVVIHLAPDSPSVLADILQRASALPVSFARQNAPVRLGTVTVAPPDRHLILEGHRAVLSHRPRENGHRPSIDVLFRSAAFACGPRVTGVVLSGMLDDGSAGLWAIRQRRGMAVVQDPTDAEFPDMPRNALDAAGTDVRSAPASELASLLARIAAMPASPLVAAAPRNMALEVDMATHNDGQTATLDELGERSPYSCPECGGALWEIDEGGVRFRCHVGHAYTARVLAAEQRGRVQAALWAALRRLEEAEQRSERLGRVARASGNARSAEYHEDRARSSGAHAATLRELLSEPTATPVDEPADEAAGD
jgi:two-component system chemotaxis response regulator CheB